MFEELTNELRFLIDIFFSCQFSVSLSNISWLYY